MLTTGYNHTTLIGLIRSGPWHNPASHGKVESAALTIGIPELGRDSQTYHTHIRCEFYGKSVAPALALQQGDTVLVEGKVAWSKGAGEGKAALCVVAWKIVRLMDHAPKSVEW